MDFGEGDGAWFTASEPHENEANERSIVAAHSGVDSGGRGAHTERGACAVRDPARFSYPVQLF